jgi:hypothetical protein
MDTKILLSEIKARFNHNLAKDYLKDKYESKLVFAEQGGLWKVTTEMLSFLRTSSDTTILLDTYNNPVVVDTKKLLTKAEETYASVMTEWATEWKKLESKR